MNWIGKIIGNSYRTISFIIKLKLEWNQFLTLFLPEKRAEFTQVFAMPMAISKLFAIVTLKPCKSIYTENYSTFWRENKYFICFHTSHMQN